MSRSRPQVIPDLEYLYIPTFVSKPLCSGWDLFMEGSAIFERKTWATRLRKPKKAGCFPVLDGSKQTEWISFMAPEELPDMLYFSKTMSGRRIMAIYLGDNILVNYYPESEKNHQRNRMYVPRKVWNAVFGTNQ